LSPGAFGARNIGAKDDESVEFLKRMITLTLPLHQ